MHLQMHAFRAIETGLPLLRAAASGISTAFDPWGRVLGVADFFAAGDRTMTAQIAVGGVGTIYARTGDLFAWLCVAALAIALGAAALVPRTRSAQLSAAHPLAAAASGFSAMAPRGRND
jgi:apolipoprotein N-acyltransferase